MAKNVKAIKQLKDHRDWLQTQRDLAYRMNDMEKEREAWSGIVHCSYCIGVLEG
jgi:hypothetical protein